MERRFASITKREPLEAPGGRAKGSRRQEGNTEPPGGFVEDIHEAYPAEKIKIASGV